jgi:hypothetical protein
MVKANKESKRMDNNFVEGGERYPSGAAETLKKAPAMKNIAAIPTSQKRKGIRTGIILLMIL